MRFFIMNGAGKFSEDLVPYSVLFTRVTLVNGLTRLSLILKENSLLPTTLHSLAAPPPS